MNAFSKFLGAAAAVALLAGATASQAAVLVPINQALLDSTGAGAFVGLVGPGPVGFSDVYTFTTTGSKSASSSVVTILLDMGSLGQINDIDFTSIMLDGYSFTQVSFDPGAESYSLQNAILGAGPHSITVTGNLVTPGITTYTGTLNIASVAVPEPATWALMITGFGGAGAMIRRRRSQAAVA